MYVLKFALLHPFKNKWFIAGVLVFLIVVLSRIYFGYVPNADIDTVKALKAAAFAVGLIYVMTVGYFYMTCTMNSVVVEGVLSKNYGKELVGLEGEELEKKLDEIHEVRKKLLERL